MLSSVVDFFRDRYLPPYCDCCNHNFDILSLESESSVDSVNRNFLRQGLASFKRWTSEVLVKPLEAKEAKASTKQRLKKFFQLGKIIGRETKHVKSDQMVARNESGEESCLDCLKSNISTDMGSIFASIAESDKPLQEEPNSPMICFLIHLASDLNIQGPFLSRLRRLPADVTQTDKFSSLSCASTWLQSSLVLIRDSYSPDSTPLDLQLPFVVLETEYQRARARATALQQQCPNEQVVTATLDLAVLKAAKLVTSAEHAFRMLRVPMESVDFSQRLLVWAEDGTNEGATQVLKDAIVAVIKSNEMGDRIEVNSLGGASEAIAEVTFRRPDQLEPGKQPRKKDSVVTRRNGSGGSSTGWLDLEDWSAADGNELQRYHTC